MAGPIAGRKLTLVPSGRPVLVELDAPREGRGTTWECVYHIRGLGRVRAGRTRGEDSLHALQLALDAVRRELEPFGARLTWTGEAGEVGLPASVPDYFGGTFRRRLEGLVRMETEREARRLQVPSVGKANALGFAGGRGSTSTLRVRPSRSTSMQKCAHLPPAPHPAPRAEGCEECLATGGRWVHLRVCLSCGHVGCCDSSPGRHASKHFRATDHATVQSFEPDETWGWCYIESEELGPFPALR